MNTQTMLRETSRRAPNPNVTTIDTTGALVVAGGSPTPTPMPAPAPMAMPAPLPDEASTRQRPPRLVKALLAIQADVGHVGKTGYNEFQKYHYQKWEDVLQVLSPLLTKHGIFMTQSEVAASLFEDDQLMSLTYEFDITNAEGDVWPKALRWTAIARVRDAKGTCDDKSANKCHTTALKYFLKNLFKIRTMEDVDDDADADDGTGRQQRRAPNPNAPPTKPAPRVIDKTHINGAQGFADAYVAAILTATTMAEVQEWYELNQTALERLHGGFPEIYEAMAARANAHIETLPAPGNAADREPAPSTGPASKPAKRPPNPFAEQVVAKTDGGIPEFLDRTPKPAVEGGRAMPSSSVKTALLGFVDECASTESLRSLVGSKSFREALLSDEDRAELTIAAMAKQTQLLKVAS